jgi:perosamine synthetase
MEKIAWWRTSFGESELENIREAVMGERISQGVITEKFERVFAEAQGVPYAVATTSGSASILMALMALGIGRGDEVIVPNRTWVATAHAVLMAGADVVLADVRADIPVLDISEVKRKITSKTKAIIAVHLNGRATDMRELSKIASEHGLSLIEDACQAMFSSTPDGYLGTLSDIGCFSLSVTKLISTGQGGLVVTKKRELYEQLKLIRNHGVTDIFTDAWSQMGFNFKYTDLLASFGLAQMERVPQRIEHIKKIYELYLQSIKEFPFLSPVPINLAGGELPLYAEFLCPMRDKLVAFLNSKSIQSRPVPPNLDISDYMTHDEQFPHSQKLGSQALYLPCGPEQPLGNVERVLDVLRTY